MKSGLLNGRKAIPALFCMLAAAAISGPVWAGQDDENSRTLFAGLSETQMAFVDRIAADFYENELRRAQTFRIEHLTVSAYLALSPSGQARFRKQRRAIWQSMSERQRRALRNAKHPLYSHLTEEQKRPFRQAALHQLVNDGAPAITALAKGARREV